MRRIRQLRSEGTEIERRRMSYINRRIGHLSRWQKHCSGGVTLVLLHIKVASTGSHILAQEVSNPVSLDIEKHSVHNTCTTRSTIV
jgi:hypothetical protein